MSVRPGDPLVIPLRVPRWAAWTWPLISIVAAVGSVALIVLDRSWAGVFWGTLLLAALIAVWGLMLAAHRTRGGAPMQIVADEEGLRSPLWELNWDRIDRMWIGPTPSGLNALNIEPLQPTDIRRPRSTTLRLNAFLGNAMRLPAIQIPEVNVDVTLAALAEQLEERAGRSLLVQPSDER